MKQSNQLTIPKDWSEILVDQFIALRKLDERSSSFFVGQIERLAIITDTDPDDESWEDMDVEELSSIIKEAKWLKTEPTSNFIEEIGDLRFKAINKVTLGEWIDIQGMLVDKFAKLPRICAVLYRKHKLNEWGGIEYEPYSNVNLDERQEIFEGLRITQIYGVLKSILDFKDKITKSYTVLFTPSVPFETEGLTQEEIDEIETAEKLNEKWAWMKLVRQLANDDITKYREVTNLPLIMVLNDLAMSRELKG